MCSAYQAIQEKETYKSLKKEEIPFSWKTIHLGAQRINLKHI